MNLLSIGGSDPSSISGIQGDVRTMSALGAHCLGIVTAITSQNTSSFNMAEPVPPRAIKSQIRSVLSDFDVSGIKIGMVYTEPAMEAVRSALAGVRVPLVVDPVLVSTTGGALLEEGAMDAYKNMIVPLAGIITPNIPEARALAGPGTINQMASRIRRMGAKSVVITGIMGGDISDHILGDGVRRHVRGPRIDGAWRGGGGVHSAALLYWTASGEGLAEAARLAMRASHDAIYGAGRPGAGLAGADAGAGARALQEAVLRLAGTAGMNRMIPECQTNFVYSGPRPGRTSDVLGISGRMVRTGSRVEVAGHIRYGGSRHVASALVEAAATYPSLRSAANIRYSEKIIRAARKAGMTIYSYDRSKEPASARSSVRWGVASALRGARKMPDAIYHTGGWGKEPMIIMFGRTPAGVADKIAMLIHK